MAAACYELNLAKHAVYPKHGPPVAMYGPGDMGACPLPTHLRSPTRAHIYFSLSFGSVEGHFGLDGRYYLIDFARVFPPETPESGYSIAPNETLVYSTQTRCPPSYRTKGAFLYRLLRPELVVRNGVALSSDSFSRFGGPTMDLREPHDTNTKNATDVLVEGMRVRWCVCVCGGACACRQW